MLLPNSKEAPSMTFARKRVVLLCAYTGVKMGVNASSGKNADLLGAEAIEGYLNVIYCSLV